MSGYGYIFFRDAVCPLCGKPASVLEFGNSAGDWVTGECEYCGHIEDESTENADILYAWWQAKKVHGLVETRV